MMQDQQDRYEQWSRILKSMRLIGGVGAIGLFLALLGPVILNQAPSVILLLALGPALLWVTTWIWEGRPPKGWSVKDPARFDQANQRIGKLTRRHLAFGIVLSTGALILVVLQIATRH